MIYVSNDTSKMYGDTVFAVEAIYPDAEVLLPTLQANYALVLSADRVADNVFGCPSAVVIDTAVEVTVTPDPIIVDGVEVAQEPFTVFVTQLRPKGAAEFLVDAKARALPGLDATTQALIKSVADTDRQNSLSLMYNNMSTTDKARAKTYFDWHKSMLAKHYELKAAIAAAADDAALAALIGSETDVCVAQYAELMAAAPYDAVDLFSYIH